MDGYDSYRRNRYGEIRTFGARRPENMYRASVRDKIQGFEHDRRFHAIWEHRPSEPQSRDRVDVGRPTMAADGGKHRSKAVDANACIRGLELRSCGVQNRRTKCKITGR